MQSVVIEPFRDHATGGAEQEPQSKRNKNPTIQLQAGSLERRKEKEEKKKKQKNKTEEKKATKALSLLTIPTGVFSVPQP